MHIEKNVQIINKLGLHARAATKLVKLVNQFDAQIKVQQGERSADAASVMGLLLLETCQGQQLQLIADGPQATAALDAVEDLINNRFEEAE